MAALNRRHAVRSPPVKGWILPLPQDVGDALDADNVLPVELHDGVVGAFVGQGRGLVVPEGSGLRFALVDEAGSTSSPTRPAKSRLALAVCLRRMT